MNINSLINRLLGLFEIRLLQAQKGIELSYLCYCSFLNTIRLLKGECQTM